MKNKAEEGVYIIGEIGQNHNGSIDIAKLIAELCSREIESEVPIKPMDAIKLTKRDLGHELAQSHMNRPYDSPNSFGHTYGEHRAFLELSDEEHAEVYHYAKTLGLDFVVTLCAESCLSLLKLITPDKLKVASRDLTNLPLLEAMAETKIPIILSTGMSDKKELDDSLEVIAKHHSDVTILHCVSEYPTQPKNLNLNTIPFLIEHYPDYNIGFSDHTIGITAPSVAVGMGAKMIEKHITIDRKMKGTDQKGSLGPDGVRRMVRDIRLTELWLGEYGMFIEDDVKQAKTKLRRSIATNRDLKVGDLITENDIHLLSPGDGFKWTEKQEVIGKTVTETIKADEIIYPKTIGK